MFGSVVGVVEVVVGLELPEWREGAMAGGYKVAEEEVDGVLLLGVGERVAVVALHGGEQVTRVAHQVARPVRLDRVHQLRARVLQRHLIAQALQPEQQ